MIDSGGCPAPPNPFILQNCVLVICYRDGKKFTLPSQRVDYWSQPRFVLQIRACSHEPGTVNYPGVMIAPGQASPRVHMMICCPGATLPRVNFIALGQVHRHLITTNLSEFL